MYLNVCECDEFLRCQKWQKIKFGLFWHNLPQLGLFHLILYVIVVLEKFQRKKYLGGDQNKQILLSLKNKKLKKIENQIFVNYVYYL